MRLSLLLSVLLLSGCAYIPAKDKAVLTANRDNAVEINSRIQTYTRITATTSTGETKDVTDLVKRWWAAEAVTWNAIQAWSNGQALGQ